MTGPRQPLESLSDAEREGGGRPGVTVLLGQTESPQTLRECGATSEPSPFPFLRREAAAQKVA